ncbi:unnamed protein product [Notodromas monacha]|uniref:Brain protein I3 n=1 Tax=Notodromas monacha TaxID=399045 RepID=A0A7R9BRE6_9CRUS|nr:unnamed protein product [Notodromas monacha]CAG0919232.1 unnamed protein product [Notodromas monacha]
MAAVVEIRIDMADDDDDGDRDPREKFCITPNRDVYILDEERISDSSFDLGSDQEKQKCLLGGEDERVLEEVCLQSKEHKKKKKLQGKKSNNELISQKPKEKKTIYAVHKCPKCKDGVLATESTPLICIFFGFLTLPMCCFGLFCFNTKKKCYDCSAKHQPGMPKII